MGLGVLDPHDLKIQQFAAQHMCLLCDLESLCDSLDANTLPEKERFSSLEGALLVVLSRLEDCYASKDSTIQLLSRKAIDDIIAEANEVKGLYHDLISRHFSCYMGDFRRVLQPISMDEISSAIVPSEAVYIQKKTKGFMPYMRASLTLAQDIIAAYDCKDNLQDVLARAVNDLQQHFPAVPITLQEYAAITKGMEELTRDNIFMIFVPFASRPSHTSTAAPLSHGGSAGHNPHATMLENMRYAVGTLLYFSAEIFAISRHYRLLVDGYGRETKCLTKQKERILPAEEITIERMGLLQVAMFNYIRAMDTAKTHSRVIREKGSTLSPKEYTAWLVEDREKFSDLSSYVCLPLCLGALKALDAAARELLTTEPCLDEYFDILDRIYCSAYSPRLSMVK